MSVEVYAATDPLRVEITVDGVVFTTAVKTFPDALRIAKQTCTALGLTLYTPGTIEEAVQECANLQYPDGKL